MVLKKKRFLIGGIIVVSAIVYLGYTGFMGGAAYYYTVSELIEQGDSICDENVRLNGQVTPGSVQQEVASRTLEFIITDGEGNLPVLYQGVVPDTFKVGNEVVIEGHLNSSGVFQAHTLMPKCASKYVPES